MRRIFLFLSIMVGLSISAQALPLHLTTHLRTVTPQDCERVIAKIAMTESKDPDLKNQLDEVPQCIVFFTERLTRESFRDKDYRKGCQDLLPDFCQQNRYLSLQTIVEKYETNRLKLMGSMGLGFMYGRTAVKEVKRIADRFKKSTGHKVKAIKSQGENVYEENVKIKEECLTRGPQDCKLTWKLKDDTCVDETKKSKTRCECVPATWTDDYNPDTKQCGKLKTECLANNGANKKPLRTGPNFPEYSIAPYNSGNKTNDALNIMEWTYDEADKNHGIKGCHIKQCKKGYMKDEYDLTCIEGKNTLCLENNNLPVTAQMVGPYKGATKADRHIDKVDYRAGSSYGIQSCFIVSCTDGYEINPTKSQCIFEMADSGLPPVEILPDCTVFDDGANGDGEDVLGSIFGAYVKGCRLVCKRNLVATKADDKKDKKCEKASDKCPTGGSEFTFAGKTHSSFYGWEFDGTKSPRQCEPLCREGSELNPDATKEEEVCTNISTEKAKKQCEEDKATKAGLKEWVYNTTTGKCIPTCDTDLGYIHNADESDCILSEEKEEEDRCLAKEKPESTTKWAYDKDAKPKCQPVCNVEDGYERNASSNQCEKTTERKQCDAKAKKTGIITGWVYSNTKCTPTCDTGNGYTHNADKSDCIKKTNAACADLALPNSVAAWKHEAGAGTPSDCVVETCNSGYPDHTRLKCIRTSENYEIRCLERNFDPKDDHRNVKGWYLHESKIKNIVPTGGKYLTCSPFQCIDVNMHKRELECEDSETNFFEADKNDSKYDIFYCPKSGNRMDDIYKKDAIGAPKACPEIDEWNDDEGKNCGGSSVSDCS